MDVLKLLEDVKNDKVSLEEAAKELKQLPYEDLGFAKLDHHRQIRSGFGEVVFCSGKSDEHLLKIYETFYKTDTEVLGTRASEHQYELVKAVIPEVTYDPLSRILKIEKPGKERIGRVAVCTAVRQILQLLKKQHRWRNILAPTLIDFMMWVLQAFIVYLPNWKKFAKPTVLLLLPVWREHLAVFWRALLRYR